MLANVSRAWSSTAEAFWKKSFQTSTGYMFWLFSVQFSSVTKLLDVRWGALKKKIDKEYSRFVRAHGDLSQDHNVAKSMFCFWSLKRNLTEEQACSVMVKLHRASEELSADRICSGFELWKKHNKLKSNVPLITLC